MLIARRVAIAAFALALPLSLARAQSVRGVIVNVGDTPVPGVVVQLVDSAAGVSARALTNDRGEFRLIGLTPGRYQLRTLRIGFRPTLTAPFVVRAGEEVTQRVQLTGVAFALDTVLVTTRNVCSRNAGDSSSTAFAVWEQARIALTATELTANAGELAVTVQRYVRVLDPSGDKLLDQATTVRTDVPGQPWRSISIDSLRRFGYVVSETDSVVYRAPGLDMLGSNAFIADHCFRLVSANDDRSRLGIAFEPTSERKRVADIKGTLWFDRASSELRSIEFAYVNTGRAQQDRIAGGRMDFARMSTGAWVITQWALKLPTLALKLIPSGTHYISVPVVADVRVTGGDLVLARRNADTLWSRKPITISGTVVDSVNGAMVSAARVVLQGTALTTSTDSAGHFALRGVLPRDYVLEVRTPSLDSMNGVQQLALTVTDSLKPVTIRVPNAQLLATAMCGMAVGIGVSRPPGIVGGVITVGTSDLPPRRATVIAEWLEGEAKQQRWIETHSDSTGRFRLCGVPLNTALAVRAIADTGSSLSTTMELGGGERYGRTALVIDRALSAGAVFTGVVITDSTDAPIADVEVVLTDLDKTVRTSASGAFRVSDIPPGMHTVVVRRVGYSPANAELLFKPNERVERRVVLGRVSVLDKVKVTAASMGPWYKGFEEHRKVGLGRFYSREQLAKYDGSQLRQVLEGSSGMRIFKDQVTSSRNRCFSAVYLDKLLIFSGKAGEVPPRLSDFPPASIEAIEWFPGPSSTPSEYSILNATCGVLVIHSRESP